MVHMEFKILYFAVNTSEVSVLLDFNKSNPFQHRKNPKKIAKQIRTIYISKQQILTKRNNCWIVSINQGKRDAVWIRLSMLKVK